MFVKVNSIAIQGLEVCPVSVEVNIASRGLPCFDIVGLPAKMVDESKLRIKTAFINSKLDFPTNRITVNLAPADIHKSGSFYDLAIAVGIYCASRGLEVPRNSLFFGELSLDGGLRHTKGAFVLGLYAKEHSFENIFVPLANGNEVASIGSCFVYGLANISELLTRIINIKSIKATQYFGEAPRAEANFSSMDAIAGQNFAKRALAISSAGGHNLLMWGSPGVGKSILARASACLQTPLSDTESVEVTKIYSSLGLLPSNSGRVLTRPFRSPHHSTSASAMLGGGASPLPGEITLAHRGVLFLDELNEFSTYVLNTLRQPLEEGIVTLSRLKHRVIFPARFTLLAASNPCACGYFGHPSIECTCGVKQVAEYQRKISGPLIDRFDMTITILPVDLGAHFMASSQDTRFDAPKAWEAILGARDLQKTRFAHLGLVTNSEMSFDLIKKFCVLSTESEKLLSQTTTKFVITPRGVSKILKLARTIADLAGATIIKLEHLAEAILYRVRM